MAAVTPVTMKGTYIVQMGGRTNRQQKMMQTDVLYQNVMLTVIMECAQVQIIVPVKLGGKYYKTSFST